MNTKTKDNPKGAGVTKTCECGTCKKCKWREYGRQKAREYYHKNKKSN